MRCLRRGRQASTSAARLQQRHAVTTAADRSAPSASSGRAALLGTPPCRQDQQPRARVVEGQAKTGPRSLGAMPPRPAEWCVTSAGWALWRVAIDRRGLLAARTAGLPATALRELPDASCATRSLP
eukprot:jgi/Ulvmu1/2304/UM013_0152.1